MNFYINNAENSSEISAMEVLLEQYNVNRTALLAVGYGTIERGYNMNICLARIDDRLIHGQVVIVWVKAVGANKIIACSDEAAADPLRKALLLQMAPPGTKAYVLPIDKAIEVYKNSKYDDFKAIYLFTNPTDVLRMVEAGVDITSVNVGGMCYKDGKVLITGAVSVDEKDVWAFRKLHEKGIELEVRKVASDSKIDLMSLDLPF